MPNIFEERENLLPYEYPELMKHKDAIRHSYWLDTEFNFTTDVNDFKVNISDVERDIISKTMLAISQIEVNVKSFWGDLYKRLPILEIQAVGATFSECHGEGTEVLTPTGWVDFKDISKGDKVIQYHKDSTLSITTVNEVIKQRYKGELINFNKKKLKTAVTPNHRMLYFNRKGNFLEKRAGDLNIHSDIMIPEAGRLNSNGSKKLSYLDRLKIAIQADGSRRTNRLKDGTIVDRGTRSSAVTYEISVKKSRKKDRLFWILSNLDLTYREYKDNRKGYIKVEVDIPSQEDLKSFDWVTLEGKTYEWCRDFIDELSHWDGHTLPHKKDCKIKYSNTDKKCIDIAQMVGIGAGYKCNISVRKDNRKESYKDVYTLSFIDNRFKVGTNTKKDYFNYDGYVYCINVDSGAIVTRYKDCTLISGNSEVRHFDAYSRLLTILGLEEEFKSLPEVPAIKGRISYLKKYLSGVRSRDNRTYTKSIILFSLFIENVSLFSQFLIIMSFNKERNLFKGMSNAVEATSKEEAIHGQFGADLVNIIRSENPSWFDEDMESMVKSACIKALKAEEYILDWIFEKGELDFLPKSVVVEFMKKRFNTSMTMIGYDPIFEVDINLYDKVLWFDEELVSTKEGDFFDKKQIDYNKKSKSITEDDIF